MTKAQFTIGFPRLSVLARLALVVAILVGGRSAIATESCLAILAVHPSAPDGDYVIEPTPDQRFTVYCHDMAGGTPKEYLTLVNTGPATLGSVNTSSYVPRAAQPGPPAVCSFSRIRLDPATLTVDIGDLTFATCAGGFCCHGTANPVNVVAYGLAFDCVGSNSSDGRANIDLTGTPFRINDTFTTSGFFAAGSAILSSNNQVADLTGGGFCGGTRPTGSSIAKFTIFGPGPNLAANFSLDLEFKGPSVPHPVPTVSEWGMASVVLLLLTGLTIKFGMMRFARKAA